MKYLHLTTLLSLLFLTGTLFSQNSVDSTTNSIDPVKSVNTNTVGDKTLNESNVNALPIDPIDDPIDPIDPILIDSPWRILGSNIYYNSGNVGIGTYAPAYKLHISKPATGWTARFQNTDGYIDIGPNNSSWAHIYTDRPNFIFNKNIWSSTGGFSSYTTANLNLQTNGTNRLTILSANGYVGIGTTAPAQQLHTTGNIRADGRYIYFGADQYLYGDNSSALSYSNNHSTITQLIMRDKENTVYGRLYGTNDGENFGLMDGDGNWSYLAAKDNYTAFRINNLEKMRILTNGNVGIGITAPAQQLHTSGNIRADGLNIYLGAYQHIYGDNSSGLHYSSNSSTNSQLIMRDLEGKVYGQLIGNTDGANFGLMDGDGNWSYLANKDNYTAFRINDSEKMRILSNGNVGIGTSNPQSELAVNGIISAKEVNISLEGWSDFVFNPDYKLPTLPEVELFIKSNKHLPGVPSEKEILENGLKLADMSSVHMQKIEELTLYIIEQQKEIDALKAKVDDIAKQLNK